MAERHPIMPLSHGSAALMWATVIGLAFACVAAGVFIRTAARRAWKRYAAEIKGEFSARNRLSPAYVSGSVEEKTIFLETAVNHDDDAPYYHTRCSMPVSNPAMLILGLRRKSLLEEAQSRGDKPFCELGDAEFERRFHLVANAKELLAQVLDPSLRRLLLRFSDVEIYITHNSVEWRRAGEVSDIKAIRDLNSALARTARSIDALPRRDLTLSQRLADEELIVKGI